MLGVVHKSVQVVAFPIRFCQALLSLTKLSSALHDWTGHWRMAMDDWQISQQRGASCCSIGVAVEVMS